MLQNFRSTTEELNKTKHKLTEAENKIKTLTSDLIETKDKLVNAEFKIEDLTTKLKITITEAAQKEKINDLKSNQLCERLNQLKENIIISLKLFLAIKSLSVPKENLKFFTDNLTQKVSYRMICNDDCIAKASLVENDIDSFLEHIYDVKINKVENEDAQFLKVLQTITDKIFNTAMFINSSYPGRFAVLFSMIDENRLYDVKNYIKLLKINVQQYVGKKLYVHFKLTSERSLYRNDEDTKYFDENICLFSKNVNKYILCIVFSNDWNNNNAITSLIHPEYDRLIDVGAARYILILNEHLINGFIILKLLKKECK